MTLDNEIQLAVQAHAMWKINLLKAIETESSDTTPETLRQDNLCAFGKWLYGDTLPEKAKAMNEYRICVELHREFHELTSDILKLALSGQKQQALAALAEPGLYFQLSSTLIQHLKLWLAKCEKINTGK